MINFLIKLSENEKRLILVIFIILIVVFYVLGLLYDAVIKYMAKQGADVGRLMGTLIKSGYITDAKHFRKIALKKSRLEFFKNFLKTFFSMIVWFAVYGTVSLFYTHWLNLFDYNIEGFTTLFYQFDFANTPTTIVFGLTVISDFPPVLKYPFFSVPAIPSYILGLSGLVIILIFIHQVSSFLARTIYIFQRSKKLFQVDIDSMVLTDLSGAPAELQESGVNTPESRMPTPPVNPS